MHARRGASARRAVRAAASARSDVAPPPHPPPPPRSYKWDSLPAEQRPERGLLGLRAGLNAFANLRPAIVPKQVRAVPGGGAEEGLTSRAPPARRQQPLEPGPPRRPLAD
jgi:hypothetical protein